MECGVSGSIGDEGNVVISVGSVSVVSGRFALRGVIKKSMMIMEKAMNEMVRKGNV